MKNKAWPDEFCFFLEELMTESNSSIDFSCPSALNLLAVTSLRKNLGASLEVIVF